MILKPKKEGRSYPVVPYDSCPAKTYVNAEKVKTFGRSVLDHCYAVGLVAEELLRILSLSNYLSTVYRDLFNKEVVSHRALGDARSVADIWIKMGC